MAPMTPVVKTISRSMMWEITRTSGLGPGAAAGGVVDRFVPAGAIGLGRLRVERRLAAMIPEPGALPRRGRGGRLRGRARPVLGGDGHLAQPAGQIDGQVRDGE